MTNSYLLEDVAVYNERALAGLAWTIEVSTGQFYLRLAHCNYTCLRAKLVERLQTICAVNIRVIFLQESARTLYTAIQEELGEEQPQALMVLGLESVRDIEQVLISANHVREEFRKNFPFPVVLWVTDDVQEKLSRLAPDFESWTTTTDFAIATDTLIAELTQRVDYLFTQLLEIGPEKFFTSELIFSSGYRQETLIAWQDLQCRGQVIDPELQAGIDLILGRNEYIRNRADIATAKEYYQKSLDFWQQTNQLERQGILLFHIGLCFSGLAEQYATKKCFCWTEARHYFQEGIKCFDLGKRQDLVAKFINKLEDALKNLEAWDDLQQLAQDSLKLQKIYDNPVQLARAYGFLAEVALAQLRWIDAEKFAQTALTVVRPASFEQQQNQSLYLLLLAEAQQNLGQNLEAINNLEQARKPGIQDDPMLYIRILNTLRTSYLEQKQYLQAFRIKKESRSIQQQYRLRAFVGAGRLKPIPDSQMGFIQTERQALLKQEIQSFGRDKAVDDLVERVASTQHKLTVVYGQSGVGKSSMLEAGLVPTLTYKTIGTRDVLPVSIRFYTNWVQELSAELGNALKKVGIETSLTSNNNSLEIILEQLRQNEQHNLLTVLIFDQFEEFFFVCNLSECDSFFKFFRECLYESFVKVLISLREDYLHLVLRGSRKFNLDIINNNILDKQILYYVGNFLPEEAKSIILSLTKRSQFDLEPELVDELVNELARDVGEVRPIELQIVGDQLQTENITTLAQYKAWGPNPKEALAQRYLEDVVADCGFENQKVAALILYLLTSENNTRPLKTRAELEENLTELAAELAAEPSKLDLVLRIFVESGLVFLLKESPADRYQLVHDYLVTFIRHQPEPKIKELITRLEEERAKRLQVEAELSQAESKVKRAKANIQVINQKAKQRTQLGLTVLVFCSILATAATGLVIHQGIHILENSKDIDIVNRVTILRQEERYAEALSILNPAIKPKSNKPFLLLARSQIYSDMKNYQEALADLQQAIQIDPKQAFFFGQLGEIYFNMNKYDDNTNKDDNALEAALANFNRAIELNPQDSWVIGRLGETYRLMGHYKQANDHFENMIQLEQDNKWAITRKGETYRLMGHYDQALECLNLAIQLDPNYAEAIANKGETYRQMGHYDQALEYLNHAMQLNPKYAFPIAKRGEAYRQMQNYDQALADFNFAIKLEPKFTWAIASRGRVYHDKKRYKEAIADFNRAIQLEPELDWVRQELQEIDIERRYRQ